MYVVAGRLKSRRLHTIKGLRVVEARVRKALYSILNDSIGDSTILDLFAGAGSLGIEALSWGARKTVFVDINKNSLNLVKRNLSSLGLLSFCELYLKDAMLACQDFHDNRSKFDIIFLDPPYHKGLLIKSLKTLKAYDILTISGFIIALSWHKETVENAGFSCIFSRKYGDRLVSILTL